MEIERMTNEWILNEIEKIRYTYGLNKVIRYNLGRNETYENTTQSVAEHVYNMLILANYFRELEDPEHALDFEKITRIILMHDMGEIETGDIVLGTKTKNHEEEESLAINLVASRSPDFIKNEIRKIFDEFENPKTPEGKFAKAIDKLEAPFWWGCVCDLQMVKNVNTVQQRIQNEEKRQRMYQEFGFKYIAKFGKVIYEKTVQDGLLLED